MLGQNKIYVFALALGILAFGIKLYTDKRPRTADLSSIESLLKTNVVGTGGDTRYYLISSYATYKNFIPKIKYQEKEYFICYRPTSLLVFAPLMFIFREYFPVFGILMFSIITYLSGAYLLRSIGLGFIPSAIMLLVIFIFTYHYALRLHLEAPVFSLLSMSLALYIKGKILSSVVFLFFASLLRPEFSVVGLLYLLKFRKLNLSFLLIPPALAIILQNVCGDQTGFYFWTNYSYFKNVEKDNNYRMRKAYYDLMDCAIKKSGIQGIDPYRQRYMRSMYPFSKYFSECSKEKLSKDVKWKVDKILKHYVENIFFLTIAPKLGRLTFLIPISVIFGILTILGLILYFKRDWLIPISYIVMAILYTVYFPYGFFDLARIKLYILPIEILLIAQLYKDKSQDIQEKIASIFSGKV